MATLSLPTNTPATDGAVIGCTTDDTTGTAYAMARDDRQWYFELSANPLVTQAMIDADKATIIAQDITASELVWAGTDVDLSSVELTVTGLDENAGPFYVGWVQQDVSVVSEYVFTHEIPAGFVFARPSEKVAEVADGSTAHLASGVPAFQGATWDGSDWTNPGETSTGVMLEVARAKLIPSGRDITGWPISKCTLAADAEGRDGAANAATRMTITDYNGQALYETTAAAGAHVFTVDIKAVTVTGYVNLYADRSDQAPVDVSALINTSTFTRFGITDGSDQLDPYVQIRCQNTGDEIIIDYADVQTGQEFPGSRQIAATSRDQLYAPLADLGLSATNTNNFTLQARCTKSGASDQRNEGCKVIELSDNTDQNRISLSRTGVVGAWLLEQSIAGVDTSSTLTADGAWLNDDVLDLRLTRDSSGTHIWGIAGTKQSVTAGTWGDDFDSALTHLYLGGDAATAGQSAGGLNILSCRVADRVLPDAEIEAWERT